MLRKLIVVLSLVGALALIAQTQKAPPAQPIAFSHKLHAGTLKTPCKTCHVNPDPGELMGIPQASTCMKCHTAVKTDSPEVQKIAAAAKSGREIRWARVYEIPTYVMFSHRAHVTAGNTCQECHGQVTEREQMFQETDLHMGGCMACHKAKSASNDCSYCHEPR